MSIEIKVTWNQAAHTAETIVSAATIFSAAAGILTVDYGQTLEQMIAAGRYEANGNNWDKHITAKRFPIVGEGIAEFEWKLFGFGHHVFSKGAVEAIKADDKTNPWEPAKTEHTLAYGAQFPEEQRKNPIIGLGSVGKLYGFRFVLALDVDDDRNLGIISCVGGWLAHFRFLAVRKNSHQPLVA